MGQIIECNVYFLFKYLNYYISQNNFFLFLSIDYIEKSKIKWESVA